MDLSVEAKDEIQLKLELAQESDYLVFEVEAMREESVKHFHLGDGSFQAVSYGSAVHRKDADGKWQDIDNTLALQNVKGTNRYSAPNSRVTFADAFSASSNIMTLRENGYSLSFSFVTNEKGNSALAKVSNHEARSSQLEFKDSVSKLDRLKAVNNTTSIKYENIHKNVDFEYVLISNNIKENIIVKEALENYSFTFNLEVEGLVAKLNDNGIITLYDEKSGKEVYTIPAPFMFDAKNELSYDVFYTLKEQSSGNYELTVTADEKWINADDRAFPVTIDPTVISGSPVWDTFVNSGAFAKDSCLGTSTGVIITQTGTGFIYIDMPSLPSGSVINSAYLHAAYYLNATSGNMYVGAYQMNGKWTEGVSGSYPSPHPPITGNTPNATSTGSTWNSLNSAYGSSLGISTTLLSSLNAAASPSVTSSNPAWGTFNITNAVVKWHSGTANNGIALKYYPGGTQNTVVFIAYEAYNEYSAYYSITYTEEKPIVSGVYRLKNLYNNKYMETSGGGTTAGTRIVQNTNSPGTADSPNRDQLFKITYLTVANGLHYYNIRPMTNSGMGVYAPYSGTERKATIENLTTEDSFGSTSWWQSWAISKNGSYFTIKNGSAIIDSYLSTPNNSTNGADLITKATVNNNSKWELVPYTGDPIDGADWYNFESKFLPSESHTYQAYMYSSTIGRNGPIEHSVTDQTVAEIDENTGYFTATKPGVINVRVTYPGAPWYWYRSVTVSDTLFVECFEEKGFWDVSNGATAQTIECNDKSQSSRGIWVFEYKNNGYYAIKNDITGRYVTESSGTVKHLTGSGSTTTQQWRLLKQSDGTYKIESRSKPGYYIIESNAIHVPVDPDIQLSNSSSVGNRNKWHLKTLIMNVDVYYDQGLIDRYANVGLTVDQFLNRIFYVNPGTQYYRTISEVLLQEFGIHLKLNIKPRINTYPYVENCIHKNNLNTECRACSASPYPEQPHNSRCFWGQHHKEASRFWKSVSTANDRFNAVLTGHANSCTLDAGLFHEFEILCGQAESGGSRFGVFTGAGHGTTGTEYNYNEIKDTFIHELMHVMGRSGHHYDSGEVKCIFGENNVNVSLDICDQCKKILNSEKYHLYKHLQ